VGVVFTLPNLPAASMAADEVNRTGGIRGRPLLLVMDTVPSSGRSRGEEIAAAARMVAGPPVVAVVGHGYSQASLVAAPYYNGAGIVQLDPTSNSRQMRDAGPWTFHMAPYDSVEGVFIAGWLRDSLKAGSVAVFYLNDEAGQGVRDGLRAGLSGSAVRIVREVRVDSASDYAPLVSSALAARPDAVVLATWETHALAIARLIRGAGSRARMIMSDAAATLPWLVDSLGPLGEGFWWPGSGSPILARRPACA
jgi:branched-chain amino acid transport system substrate-binding protein